MRREKRNENKENKDNKKSNEHNWIFNINYFTINSNNTIYE